MRTLTAGGLPGNGATGTRSTIVAIGTLIVLVFIVGGPAWTGRGALRVGVRETIPCGTSAVVER